MAFRLAPVQEEGGASAFKSVSWNKRIVRISAAGKELYGC